MIINLLCKALIAILDILLLDFYLKNIYPEVYQKKFYKIKYVVFLVIFLISLFINNIITYIFNHLVISIFLISVYSFLYVNIIDIIKKIFLLYVFQTFIQITTILILSWVFNIKVFTFYTQYRQLDYSFLSRIIAIYIVYVIFTIKWKNTNTFNLLYFKLLSLTTFLFFIFVFLLNNDTLFRIPVIARTYIFTVVISIVALICFDRMQTKYETDKHNKEAIIQNMAKEEEFVQELEKQQLEIRKINHNLNHILIILQSHLKQGEYKEALEYIDKNLDIHIKAYQALTHTGMTMIDSTINHQIYQMKEQNIEYDEDITKILHLGSIVPDDLSLVLGLAFDNAREACEKVKDQRKISLKLQSKQTHIIIHITNSIPRGSHPYFHKTSKKDSVAHGYGVKGIKEIAKKYHGDVKYDVKDDCVILRIMLQK